MRSILLTILFALSIGCGPGATTTTTPLRDYAGPVRAPSSYGTDFAIDHQITAVHAEGSDTFRALLEKRGDALVMVALGPHGSRAFTLAQEGAAEPRFESQLPRELPFPPRFMLVDVHRTWLVGLDAARADGEHTGELDTPAGPEMLTETWADGRLLSRSFTRRDVEGAIRITYEGGLSPDPSAPPPTRVELDNGWFGYRLVMQNITRRPL
ncbi:DUF3261 domain-containing protein [Sandaracinus amylolyticus]|uniref:DUF3261 domain-containing protein n=1 Tax=Sandaracinus amylolyticus TaxID=927083 RepID=UPI001F198548|nr:DUF3261 domain-containing protein [Sandaracinus amylolyticus]UJR85190.1 Hypothetical protein I5071_72700 [Sandaracinus amylolyticus]